MTRPTALALILAALAACSGGSDGYPALVPTQTILAGRAPEPNPAPDLTARGDALRARADALRTEMP